MKNKTDFNDQTMEEKVKIILENDNSCRKWNDGLFIKSLILSPLIIFLIGLFIVNRPETLNEILFFLLYPLSLIIIGVIILFLMRRNLE